MSARAVRAVVGQVALLLVIVAAVVGPTLRAPARGVAAWAVAGDLAQPRA